jgi:hypothetical protein
MFFRSKDPDDRHAHEVHFSDLAIIAIAAMLTAVAVYLLVTPEDYGAYFAKASKALSNSAPQQQQQSRPGETQMMLFDGKKK